MSEAKQETVEATMSDEKPELTMRDIGRLGGNKLKEKIGSAGFAELGHKGGSTTWERYGPAYYSRIGKQGQAARDPRRRHTPEEAARREQHGGNR